jgi:ribonuclease T1
VFFSGRLPQWYPLRRWGLGVSIAVSLLLGLEVQARQQPLHEDAVALAQLPAEAQSVHRLIHAGGPFMHSKDGAVFGNRERALPPRSRGFYREYTVATPGARDRGARRIVCGGREPKTPDACFYSADHYTSFRRITP